MLRTGISIDESLDVENSINNNKSNEIHPYKENLLEKSYEGSKNYGKSSRNESFTKDENLQAKQNSVCTTELYEPTFKHSDTCSVRKKIENLEEIKFHENPMVLKNFIFYVFKFFFSFF